MNPDGLIPALVVVTPLMAATVFLDLKYLKIPNWLTLAVAGSFVVLGLIFLPLPALGFQLLVGGIALLAGFLLFLPGLMGGGDAKMLAAAVMFVPPHQMAAALLLFCVVTLASLATVGAVRLLSPAGGASLLGLQRRARKFPLGVAIGISLVAYLALRVYFERLA